MKPPIPIPPGSQDLEPVIPQSEGFRPAVLASAVALGFLLVAGLLAGLRLSTAPPPPARAAARVVEGSWLNREAVARQRLRGEPGEDGARLQLAGALIGRALVEAQQAYPADRTTIPAEAAALEARSADHLRSSQRTAEALRLTEGVAKHGRDGRQRALAWIRLAWIHSLLGHAEEATTCNKVAAREDPAYSETLNVLRLRSRSGSRWAVEQQEAFPLLERGDSPDPRSASIDPAREDK